MGGGFRRPPPIAACSSYVGGHHCPRIGVKTGEDTVPLTVPYSWECVRDCPWKGANARLLVRYGSYLSKFSKSPNF
jgi:hypothetical protein